MPDSDQLQNPPEQQQTRPDKTEAPNLALSTIITLTLLALITAGAAVVGLNALFQPFPGEDDPVISDPDSTPSATCEEDPAKEGKAVHARDVTVNVFNAGSTAGLASTTLMTLGERGFQIGVAGNAPSGTEVPRVQVWATDPGSTEAKLVALQFGRNTIIRKGKDLAPGINVIVGTKFTGFKPAPRQLRPPATAPVCPD
ncbi:MAG: LytR C-terminal domain-containing protein [Nocardioidaceae bacterium]|nr:MAG: LytR C-terminal domain-containing protein [Nocardioidaceae bacterium]